MLGVLGTSEDGALRLLRDRAGPAALARRRGHPGRRRGRCGELPADHRDRPGQRRRPPPRLHLVRRTGELRQPRRQPAASSRGLPLHGARGRRRRQPALRLLQPRPGNARSPPRASRGASANGIGAEPAPPYKPRVLSADGRRLFFDTADPLVPQDTNGDRRRLRVGGAGRRRAAPRPDGCVALISSGRSANGATFLDASSDGSRRLLPHRRLAGRRPIPERSTSTTPGSAAATRSPRSRSPASATPASRCRPNRKTRRRARCAPAPPATCRRCRRKNRCTARSRRSRSTASASKTQARTRRRAATDEGARIAPGRDRLPRSRSPRRCCWHRRPRPTSASCRAMPASRSRRSAEGGSEVDTLAGSHPYSLITEVNFNQAGQFSEGDLQNLHLDLPAGLIENPTAVPTVSAPMSSRPSRLPVRSEPSGESCPTLSQIGIVTVKSSNDGGEARTFGVFNLDPPPGQPVALRLRPLRRADHDHPAHPRSEPRIRPHPRPAATSPSSST